MLSGYGYKYTLDGVKSTISNSDYYTGTDSLDYKGYNSMYAGKNGSKGEYYWWLASPSSCNSVYRVCIVNSLDVCLGNYDYYNVRGICPLVSLKSGIPVQVDE